MKKIELAQVISYVEQNIDAFHASRLSKLKTMKLKDVIQRKNPYLFRAKNMISGPELVKAFLDAFISSQEEAIFGTFLEGLAVFVSASVHSERKSSAEGIDLELTISNVTYIVSIKSGPNWGNSSQIRRMVDNFKKAKKILGTNRSDQNVVAVNGCCYGTDASPDKGDYLKYCGQRFWHFISGDPDFYIDIVEPIGHKASERDASFQAAYAKVVTEFTAAFIAEFCDDGVIVWDRILKLNSAIRVPKITAGNQSK